MRGGKISSIKKAMIISVVCILFFLIGSVCAADDSLLINESTVFDDSMPIESPYGDNNYSSDEIIKESVLSENDTEMYYKNGTSFKVVLSDGEGSILANQSIIFKINDVNYTRTTNNEGVASIAINLMSGNYSITSFYSGNENFSPVSATATVKVLPTINGKDITKYYTNDTQYYATFADGKGKALADEMVTFNINGVFYQRKTNENGTAKLNINLLPGKYILTAINPINGEMYSNIVEVLATLSGSDLTMIYRDGHRFTSHVIDDNGNPLAKSSVEFNINGVFYTRTTDSEGNAYLNINLDAGEYIITATNYKGLSVSNMIYIAKCNSTFKAGDAHIITGFDRDYNVILMGSNNRTIPFSQINFRFNGAGVASATDENGEATMHISNPAKGKYVIEYEFEGNINYNPFKSSSAITVEDPTNRLSGNNMKMLYNDGSKFNVTLTDLSSLPVYNHTITFNICGRQYDRTTDENGVASLNINLIPGTYEISYTHSNPDDADYNKGSNIVIVSKLPAYLSTKDLAFEFGDNEAFTAVLTDSGKNPLKGMDVTFTIGGKSYTRGTDDDGAARLNINLDVGYYDITVSLDNQIYAAGSKSNHVLVNGTILISDDLYLIAELTRDYSVTLLNAYRNPISNAVIEFIYNGVTKHATTNSQGVATIAVGGLAKGDYPIVYRYVTEDNAGQSNVHVTQSVLNSKNTISNLSPYLSSTRNCPVSNSEIVALANKLTEGLTQPLDKAIAIFDYVRDAISYSYYYDTYYGAVGTLHAKRGNCVDQSHLSIALYRAAGFPARYVHGSCVFRDGDSGGHVWTQVLVGDTWIVSDSINVRNSLGEVTNWNNNNYQLKGYYSSLSF